MTRNPNPSDYQLLLPELRMENTQSCERDREYYHSRVNVYCLYPNCSFEIYPIKCASLNNIPLSRILMRKMTTSVIDGLQTGFLSWTNNNSLNTHTANDPSCENLSLVGIWITGLSFNEEELNNHHLTMQEKEDIKMNVLKHPTVWASLVRFLLYRKFNDLRSSNPDKNSFLLLNFLNIDSTIHPKMYEFKLCEAVDENENYWVVSKFKGVSGSCLTSTDKNQGFKFSTDEMYTFEQFYNHGIPIKRQSKMDRSIKRSLKGK